MFNLGSFIKGGLIAAVGKMADYQIILNAAGWFEKGVLTETDLAEIQAAIDEKNARLEAERIEAEEAAKAAEESMEESTEENGVEEGNAVETIEE